MRNDLKGTPAAPAPIKPPLISAKPTPQPAKPITPPPIAASLSPRQENNKPLQKPTETAAIHKSELQKKITEEKKKAKIAAASAKNKALQDKKVRQLALRQLEKQAELKFTAKEFNAAVADAQKITDNEESSWFAKRRAKKLIKKIQKAARKNNTDKTINKSESVTTPTPITPKPIIDKPPAAPVTPPNLPVLDEITTIKPTPLMTRPPVTAEIKSETPKPPVVASRETAPPIKIPEKTVPPIPSPPAEPAPKAPPAIPADLKPKSPKASNTKKIAIAGFITISILILAIGGLWFFLDRPPEQPAQTSQMPTPQPSIAIPTPDITPTSLIKTDTQKIFELRTGQEKANFQEAIAQITELEEPIGSLVSLLFKNTAGEFLSLDELTSFAEIDLFNLPTQASAGSLKNQLDMSSFSLFAYSQNRPESSPFAPEKNPGRIGIIISIKNATSTDDLTKSLKDLEQLMPSGLKILIPEAKNNIPAKPSFIADQYNEINFRYTQIPDASLGIAYAIVGDKLLIATSKDSFRSAIDRLLEK